MNWGRLLSSAGQSLGEVHDRRQEREGQKQAARLASEERARKRTLEDALLARSNEEYEYKKSMRPLEQRSLEARIADQEAQAGQRRAATGMQGRPKPRAIPSSAIEKMVGVDNMISGAQDVEKSLDQAIREKRNVTGRIGGLIPTPTWVKNTFNVGNDPSKGDREGTRVRAMIGSLKGTLAKERAGTSMTPTELNLLESYVPTDNEDEATALEKSRQFIKALNQIKTNRMNAYAKYGMGGVMDDEAPPSDRIEQGLPFSSY